MSKEICLEIICWNKELTSIFENLKLSLFNRQFFEYYIVKYPQTINRKDLMEY